MLASMPDASARYAGWGKMGVGKQSGSESENDGGIW